MLHKNLIQPLANIEIETVNGGCGIPIICPHKDDWTEQDPNEGGTDTTDTSEVAAS